MIEINNKTKPNINKVLVRKTVQKFLTAMKLDSCIGVSIAFVGQSEIKRLNFKWRGKNIATDVLAFSNLEGGSMAPPAGAAQYLGEVIICYPQALKQAQEQQSSVWTEIKILLIHGLLHLLGYEHKKKQEAMVMRQLERDLAKETR